MIDPMCCKKLTPDIAHSATRLRYLVSTTPSGRSLVRICGQINCALLFVNDLAGAKFNRRKL